MGAWNEATQQGILDTRVAVGGTGGAGYLIAVALAHAGVQRFSIADPETMDRTNGNRVLGAREDTYGVNKALVCADEIHAINEDADVQVYTDGVTEENVEEFMYGADLVLEATEYNMPEIATMLCRQARRQDLPVLNAAYILHGAQVTSFHPRSKWTFERVMNLKGGEDAPLDEIKGQTIDPSRYIAYVPPYADYETLKALYQGAPVPSNMTGAGLASLLAVDETVAHVRQRIGERGKTPTFAREVRWMDLHTGKGDSTRHPVASFYTGVLRMQLRNRLGLNEPASYTAEERANRGDVDQ